MDFLLEKLKIDKKRAGYLVLIFNSFSLFANSYQVSDFATQQAVYKQQLEEVKNFQYYFNLLFTSSFFVLIIVNIVMGKLCDQFRPGKFIIGACGLSLCSSLLVFAGVVWRDFYLLFLGRFFVSMANTPFLMANNRLLDGFFEKNQKATTTGVCLMMNLMGNYMNLKFTGVITKKYGFIYSQEVILALNFCSFFFCVFVFNLDKKFLNCQYRRKAQEIMESSSSLSSVSQEDLAEQVQLEAKENNSWLAFLRNISPQFICFAFGQGFINVTSSIIEIIGPKYLNVSMNYSIIQAGSVMSVISLVYVVIPLISFGIDETGKPIYWMIPSALLGIFGFFGLNYFDYSPSFFMGIIGLCFCFRWSTVFSGIDDLIDGDNSSKAFGFMKIISDISGVVVSYTNGILYTKYGSYEPSVNLLCLMCCAGLAFILLSIIFKQRAKYLRKKAKRLIKQQSNECKIQNQKQQILQNKQGLQSQQLNVDESILQNNNNNFNQSKHSQNRFWNRFPSFKKISNNNTYTEFVDEKSTNDFELGQKFGSKTRTSLD